MTGAVASGHLLTSRAALEILNKGGNAFDAAVGAAFAATITEPCLTSLGGGGFMLAYKGKERKATLYDFFVDSPGLGLDDCMPEPHFEPIDVHFNSTTQVFHAGLGSVAVPGMMMGLAQSYKELCTLDIDDIIAPTLRYLGDGVEINDLQTYLLRILRPILTLTDYGKELYSDKAQTRLYNPLLREFLMKRDPNAWVDTFYGFGADVLGAQMKAGQGLVTSDDMRSYSVNRKTPLSFTYRDYEVLTNPSPSFGGDLLRLAFEDFEDIDFSTTSEAERYSALVRAMHKMNHSRNGAGGTTHISVIDSEGNAASMTSSNGSNSGCFLGDTGVMLNNMMGEDDLHPDGFHSCPAGIRVGSMMSPSIIRKDGQVYAVLGSGGSKRIRTAMLQTIHNLIDRGMSIQDAVEYPRIHLDDEGTLQVEPDINLDHINTSAEVSKINHWDSKDLYFGGVHAVLGDLDGWGDTRRNGSYLKA